MHLHDLKYWIALIVLIASVVHISCLVNSSASFYLNEVADFDDIVELDNEKEKVNFEELSAKNPDFEAPEEEGPDPLKINLIEAPSRVKTDVRGVQNKLLNSPYLGPSTHHSAEHYKNSLGQFPQPKGKLNIFESPLIYEVQDDNPQQGYFLVKQRKSDDQPKYKKSGKGIHEGGGEQNLHHNMGNVLETESQQPENCVEEKLDQKSKTKLIASDPGLDMKKPDTFCNQLFEIFHKIPQIVKQLADSTDPQTRNTNWKSIKCIIRQQNPNFARSGILDRPESKNCFQKFIRRRKRHSTYINFRNRKKKFNNNLAKRNAPDDSRFKNIIDFIIKNKSFRSNYTYVPVLFATVKSVDLNQLETSEISPVTDGSSTENLSLQTSSSSASKSTNMSSTNSLLMSSNNTISGITTVKTDNTESMKPTISEGSTSTIIHSDSSAGGSATATFTLVPAMKEAKNLTEELSFRIPRLRESFQDIMDLMKDEPIAKRMKKEISDSASTTNVAEGNSIGSTRKNDTTPSSPPSNSTVPITTTVISTVNPESINPSISSTEHVPFPSESHFNFTISDKSSTKIIDKLELKLPFSGTDMKTMIANGSVCATKLSNVTSSFPIDGNVIPGVLIYPINSETLNNKSKRGIQEEEEYSAENKLGGEYSAENNLGINYYFTIDEPNLNANKKYIDFNPLPKLKKDVLNDCQNETEEMLNVLKSLNMKVPDEIENSKDKFGPDLTNSTSNIVPNTTETASITELSTETTNVMDFNSLSGINISSLMETNPIPNVIKPVANINKMKLFNSSNVETTIDIDAWCATSIGAANEIIPSITIPSRSAKTTTPSSTDTFSTIISSETPEISTKSETS
ncbi:unnamed protein product, partial [Phaedon cochleariae]